MREGWVEPSTLEAVLAGLTESGREVAGLFPFEPLPAPHGRCVVGVDGGSAVVLDTGFSTIGAWRAGWAGLGGGLPADPPRVGPLRLACVSQEEAPPAQMVRLAAVAGGEIAGALEEAWPSLAPAGRLGLLREAEELAVARELLPGLRGGLVLLDGALGGGPLGDAADRVLVEAARASGALLAGLAKTTALAFRGRPLVPLLRSQAPEGPWWVRVPAEVAGRDGTFIVSPLGDRAFRLDVGHGEPEDVLAALLATCNDLAVPGYPYPLYRVHCDVAMSPDDVSWCRVLIEEALAERGAPLPSSFHEVLDVMR